MRLAIRSHPHAITFRGASIAVLITLLFMGLTSRAEARRGYNFRDLVSDVPGLAKRVDPNLVNPWGISVSSSNSIWVANNGTGTSTIYDTHGVPSSLVVTIPPSATNTDGANPTGTVFNSSTGFVVSEGGNSGPSIFLFVSEDGSISGWNPAVLPDQAVLAVDHGAEEAIYKGATLGTVGSETHLYVTNFHARKVEIYDENFAEIDTAQTFVDPDIPSDYAPFGIQNINGSIYVTYAKQDADGEDDVPGEGHGFVDVFDTSGNFVQRFASHGGLNSPWGLTLAPHEFGEFSDMVLVGNFGDGRIHAFDINGTFLGPLIRPDGTRLEFDGLWALFSINNAVYFTAGIEDETHGLFGMIIATK